MTAETLDIAQFAVTSLSTILVAVYVVFTALTFRQIKRQNELQTRSFLTISVDRQAPKSEKGSVKPASEAYELTQKWKSLVEKIYEQGFQKSANFQFFLKLQNRGKSAIHQWEIHFTGTITPSPFLVQTARTSEESFAFSVHSDSAAHIIEPDEEIAVALIDAQYFPQFAIRWKVNYKDVRGHESSEFGGDSEAQSTNRILWDYDPQAAESYEDDVPF